MACNRRNRIASRLHVHFYRFLRIVIDFKPILSSKRQYKTNEPNRFCGCSEKSVTENEWLLLFCIYAFVPEFREYGWWNAVCALHTITKVNNERSRTSTALQTTELTSLCIFQHKTFLLSNGIIQFMCKLFPSAVLVHSLPMSIIVCECVRMLVSRVRTFSFLCISSFSCTH